MTTPLAQLPILVYHYFGVDRTVQTGIKPEDIAYITPVQLFRTHLEFLANEGYQPVSFQHVAESLTSTTGLPSKPMVITIDDGHQSVARFALPLLAEFGFSSELFVIPSRVGQPGYLDWDTLGKLSQSGMAVQSHGLTHRYLTKLTPEEVRYELSESKRLIDLNIGKQTLALAVPMGRYPEGLNRELSDVGYKIGCTSTYGLNRNLTSLLALERIMIKAPNDTVEALGRLLNDTTALAWQMRLRNLAKRWRNRLIG